MRLVWGQVEDYPRPAPLTLAYWAWRLSGRVMDLRCLGRGHDPDQGGAGGLCHRWALSPQLSVAVRFRSDRLKPLHGPLARMQGGEIAMRNSPHFIAVDVSMAMLDLASSEEGCGARPIPCPE